MRISLPGKQTQLLAAQILSALLSGFFVYYSITDGDIFWHLAAGREMAVHGSFLYRDPFSFTATLPHWIDVHWLFQLLAYVTERAGGLHALLVLKALSLAAALFLVVSSFPRNATSVAVAFAAATVVYCQRYLVPARPVVASLLIAGFFIACLERYSRSGKLRFLIAILPAQIAWANIQGLFMLGPVIAACYGMGELFSRTAARRLPGQMRYLPALGSLEHVLLALSPFALAAVSCCNPYGSRAILFSVSLFLRLDPSASNIYARAIDENLPLLLTVGTASSRYLAIAVVILSVLLISSLLSRRSLRLSHCLLSGAGLLLGFMALRNGILLTFFSLPAIIWNAFHITSGRKLPVITRIVLLTAMILAAFAALSHSRMLRSWPQALSPFSHPTETTPVIDSLSLPGNIFNADRHGGYLLWRLFPGRKVSSDTRLTLRTETFFREYLSLLDRPEGFPSYAKKWNITHAVLPLAPLDRYLPLAAFLYIHPEWNLVSTDGAEALFVHVADTGSKGLDLDDPETVDSIFASLARRFSRTPLLNEATMYLGRWCAAAGALSGAERILASCDGGNCRTVLAMVKERRGFPAEAERTLRSVISANPRNSEARLSLVLFYLRNGRRDEGLEELRILLEKDPFNRSARKVLYSLGQR